jgi:hypothetical protein
MPAPVKISDKLLGLAKEEARSTHRSATAQIEHWATLGRAVEVILAYRDVLALKRVGEVLPVPAFIKREEVHELLAGIAASTDRERVKARVRAAGTAVYTSDPEHPGVIVEIQPDGSRVPGHFQGRRFVLQAPHASGNH